MRRENIRGLRSGLQLLAVFQTGASFRCTFYRAYAAFRKSRVIDKSTVTRHGDRLNNFAAAPVIANPIIPISLRGSDSAEGEGNLARKEIFLSDKETKEKIKSSAS